MRNKFKEIRTSTIPAFSIVETIVSTIIISVIISISTVILANSYNVGKEKNELAKQLELNNLRVSLYKRLSSSSIDSVTDESSFDYQKKIINESLNELSISDPNRPSSKLTSRVFLIRNE